MALSWKDSTSYSQGERGHSAPRAWEAQGGGMRLVIHRFHGIDQTIWFGTVYNGPPINRVQLKSPVTEVAQAELVGLVRQAIEKMLHGLA